MTVRMEGIRITHVGAPHRPDRGRRLAAADRSDLRPARPQIQLRLGNGSRRLAGPALVAADLGPIDAVLLSHDHHDDNLDDAGRALLPSAGVVVHHGARCEAARRQRARARGSASTTLEAPGRTPIEVTATPCRHGPPLSHPIVGEVVGFALRWEGQEHGVLWISGDTVLYDGVREVADRLEVDTALVHLGGVTLPRLRPAALHDDRRRSGRALRPDQAPDGDPDPLRGLEALPPGSRGGRGRVRRRPRGLPRGVRWLPIGEPVELSS